MEDSRLDATTRTGRPKQTAASECSDQPILSSFRMRLPIAWIFFDVVGSKICEVVPAYRLHEGRVSNKVKWVGEQSRTEAVALLANRDGYKSCEIKFFCESLKIQISLVHTSPAVAMPHFTTQNIITNVVLGACWIEGLLSSKADTCDFLALSEVNRSEWLQVHHLPLTIAIKYCYIENWLLVAPCDTKHKYALWRMCSTTLIYLPNSLNAPYKWR